MQTNQHVHSPATSTVVPPTPKLPRPVKLLIIVPGFGVKKNPAQFASVSRDPEMGGHCSDLPDPDQVNPTQHLGRLLADIQRHQPDVLVAASKGGKYLIELWRSGQWLGPCVMINAHPLLTAKSLPPVAVNLVVTHGSKDQVFIRPYAELLALEQAMNSRRQGSCKLYYGVGDGHDQASLLQNDCLPRLIKHSMYMAHPTATSNTPHSQQQPSQSHPLGLDLRATWQSQGRKGMDQNKLFLVHPGSGEYQQAVTMFNKTMSGFSVDKLERIENGAQHETSSVQAHVIKSANGASSRDQISRMLFHGADLSALASIINGVNGFQPLLAGTATGAIWGDGTYFARDAKYSDSYAARLPTGQKQLLLVQVAVGRFCQGQQGMKICPVVPGTQYRRYDSMVDKPADPTIFVVQHSAQAYPAYLFTYH